MRLLLVTQDFPPNTGGIETYCFELSKRFSKEVEHFAVIAPSHKDAGPFDSQLPYRVYRIPVKNSLLPLLAPIPVVHFSQKDKFDTILHAQWQTVGASVLSRKLGYPDNIYVSAHARELLISPFYGSGGIASETLHSWRKKLLGKVNGFFPVSEYTASLLYENGIPEQTIHVLGNGTDPELFKPKNSHALAEEFDLSDKQVILTICRLIPRKGIGLVFGGLSYITKKRQDVMYLIGGTGPDKQRLQSLVSQLELENFVRFLGRIPDKRMAERSRTVGE
jgi:phosphatidylinositol alpha-1,6-mannosyltransferase